MIEYKKYCDEYGNMSEKKKQALLIYKTKLSFCINEISSIENFEALKPNEIYELIKNKKEFLNIYNKYKNILSSQLNYFIKFSTYSCINFDNVLTFIESLKNVYFEIIDKKETIVTQEEMKVYRLVSLDNEELLSKSNLVSTTLDINVCEDFVVSGKKHVLYEIYIPKGSYILVCPYSIKSHSDLENTRLEVKKDDTQKEIIFNKDDFDIEILSEKYMNLDSDKLILKRIKLKQKTKKL